MPCVFSSAQTERPEGTCQRFLAFNAKHHFGTVQGRQKVTGIVFINSDLPRKKHEHLGFKNQSLNAVYGSNAVCSKSNAKRRNFLMLNLVVRKAIAWLQKVNSSTHS